VFGTRNPLVLLLLFVMGEVDEDEYLRGGRAEEAPSSWSCSHVADGIQVPLPLLPSRWNNDAAEIRVRQTGGRKGAVGMKKERKGARRSDGQEAATEKARRGAKKQGLTHVWLVADFV
jgi:hypothetical protein